MAEDQEKTIWRLEQRLKEQDDQVRRERREIQNKASTTKTRASLLEEQVSCLKEQLMREQSELRASERAWAFDRAALMTTVAGNANVVSTSLESDCRASTRQRSPAPAGAQNRRTSPRAQVASGRGVSVGRPFR